MIGYYVHHHGSGHHRRMSAIARHLQTPMTVLSSAAPPVGYEGPWLALPSDFAAYESCVDRTANGTAHWAPLNHSGLRERMAAIASWIQAANPSLFVVDVSCEVARFVRLMGVPVVVVAMPGNRTDRVHVDAYDAAQALLAPWTARFAEAEWPKRWLEKTWHVGAFSTADEQERSALTAPSDGHRVALLAGSGGSDITRMHVEQAQAATPGWRWHILGIPGYQWQAETWPMLRDADVVVTHAGQNAIAEVAAARRPAVVLPQERPHGEQLATALSLHKADLATVLMAWPEASEWLPILEATMRRDGSRWCEWSPGDGAARAAALIDQASGEFTRCCRG
jgi:hypothetical protein